jgi:ArsR family transcriptional regulator
MELIEQCCAPVLCEPLESHEAEELAAAFKLLSDPTRLRILSLIANSADGELCACDLPEATGKSQPTVSHHLTLLTEAGLLEREQRGKWAWFRVDRKRVEVLRAALEPSTSI